MKTLLPFIAWLAFLALAGRSFMQNHWEGALVVFAALNLVPPGLRLLGRAQAAAYWPAAAGLGAGYLLFPRMEAALLALPYLLWAAWLTVREVADLLFLKKYHLANWVRAVALGYWATGAAWSFFFLSDLHPLGFDAVIVGLTAAHFHVAGFVLAVVAYCLLTETPGRLTRLTGWGVLAGMPLVAAGITATQLGYSPVLEWASALGFVALALATAAQQVRLAFQARFPLLSRWLWRCGVICLFAGTALAALYALRFFLPLEWVNIPNMKIWHGTLNAAGFGWLVLLGWIGYRCGANF